MDEDQQQFDTDDFTGVDGQNGDNAEEQQTVDDGGDQAMETGGEEQTEDDEDDSMLIQRCTVYFTVVALIIFTRFIMFAYRMFSSIGSNKTFPSNKFCII